MNPDRVDSLPRWLRATALPLALLACSTRSSATPPVTGSLETIDGVRVLKLWGSPHEQGYAHGFLLGREIIEFLDEAVFDPRVMKEPQRYEQRVRKEFVPHMELAPDRRCELEGMLAGMAAAVGREGTHIERLGRSLDVDDLAAVNALADWYRVNCSSFTAWGEIDGKKELITGRNLDFLQLPGLDRNHVMIVYLEPGQGRKRWVSISWIGLIGAYTAINEDGVMISMHDAPGQKVTHDGRFVPRALALREAIETARAAHAVDDVAAVLRRSPAIAGNNIHVSSPYTGQAEPAAVLEYDGDESKDAGATLRRASGNSTHGWVACTNHYRLRNEPRPCERYAKLESALLAQTRGEVTPIDLPFARRVLADVGVPGTMHSVVFFPNRGEFHVSFAAPGTPAHLQDPARFELKSLLAPPTAPASTP